MKKLLTILCLIPLAACDTTTAIEHAQAAYDECARKAYDFVQVPGSDSDFKVNPEALNQCQKIFEDQVKLLKENNLTN